MKWWYGLVFNTVLIILVLLTAIVVRTPKLTVVDSETGKKYGQWSIQREDFFSIEFIHSVHQSPVIETFRVEKNAIYSYSVKFYDFGAGMQTNKEDGQTLTRDGEAFVLKGLNRSFKELNYIVGTVSDHILTVNNIPISLRELCGRNAHIRIFVTS
ncbi:MAG: DUF1850 domain-containing protein [Treponema sp.]|jgi:hypothetical protein|nr:DUF1850 domain-containing protein [Treponema sp.]